MSSIPSYESVFGSHRKIERDREREREREREKGARHMLPWKCYVGREIIKAGAYTMTYKSKLCCQAINFHN